MAILTISAAGGDWGDTATWDEGAVPTNLDDVVVRADGTSGSVTVTAAATAKTLDLSGGVGYSGTFTINSGITLTVSGNVALNSSGTCPGPVGSGTININVTANLTSNGKTFACNLSHNTSANTTLTLIDDAIVTGLLSWSGSFTPKIAGVGRTITAAGGVNTTSRAGLNADCRLLITGGTCTSTIAGTTGYGISGAGTVEFDGNITMTSLFVRTDTIRYTSGTWGSGTFNTGSSPTLYGSPPINNLSFRQHSGTLTLTAPLTITGTLNPFDRAVVFAGGQTVTVPTISTSSVGSIQLGDCTWVVGSVVVGGTGGLSIRGASLTVDELAINAGGSFSFGAGYTLSVSTIIRVAGLLTAFSTVQSDSPGTQFTLDLSSAIIQSGCGVFTDVAVASPRTIYNVYGGTLTNVSRIENKLTNESMTGVDPGVDAVLSGVEYIISGSPLTGSFTGKTSSGSIG